LQPQALQQQTMSRRLFLLFVLFVLIVVMATVQFALLGSIHGAHTHTDDAPLLPHNTPTNFSQTPIRGRRTPSVSNRTTLISKPISSSRTAVPSHVIFFNIFIPHSDSGQENSLRIVREQVDQIKNSYALRSNKDLIVYFVTLGQAGILTPELMQQYCGPDLSSRHVEHVTQGNEVVTLGHMHKYCQEHDDSTSVIYLHNKGSFHRADINENWRPMLTDAALSEMCVETPPTCNLCGLNFFTMWTPFFPGNMFKGRAIDYISASVYIADSFPCVCVFSRTLLLCTRACSAKRIPRASREGD
jgi:hypothetical protein